MLVQGPPIPEPGMHQGKQDFSTVADDHSGFQRFVCEGLVADAAGPLVDVEEAAHAVTGAVQIVQPRIPQSCPGKGVQQVTWEPTDAFDTIYGSPVNATPTVQPMESR